MQLTNHYKTMTGLQSDTYFTGKLYPKLDAYVQNDKDAPIFYICSSNQYKTQRRFKQSIVNNYSLTANAKIIIKRGI